MKRLSLVASWIISAVFAVTVVFISLVKSLIQLIVSGSLYLVLHIPLLFNHVKEFMQSKLFSNHPGIRAICRISKELSQDFDISTVQHMSERLTRKHPHKYHEMIKEGCTDERYAYRLIGNNARASLLSGEMYLYRGVLDPQGTDLLALYKYVLKKSVELGDLEKEGADVLLQDTEEQIKQCG